jgi:hypothetical protein
MGAELSIALLELIIKYGPTAAISLIKGLETDSPTPEQIRALKVESPEHYFEDDK